MFKSENLEKLPTALIALQADLKPVHKDAKSHNSRYATLYAVMQSIQPALKQHGFSIVQTTLANGRGAALETVLLHTSGEYISSTIDVPVAKANDPQAYGSALSYGRRYSIMALLGLVTTDEDDDALSATITLEQRLGEVFAATNLEELNSARVTHDGAVGLNRIEKMAVRAALKAMNEHLSTTVS